MALTVSKSLARLALLALLLLGIYLAYSARLGSPLHSDSRDVEKSDPGEAGTVVAVPGLSPSRPIPPQDLRVIVVIVESSSVRTPAATASVLVWDEPRGAGDRTLAWNGSTDDRGKANVPVRRLPSEIVARKAGYIGASRVVDATELSKGECTLELRAYATLSVRVQRRGGYALEGALVSLAYPPQSMRELHLIVPSEAPASREVRIRSDARGEIRVRPVIPGQRLSLRVEHDDYGLHTGTVPALAPGEHRELTIDLEPRGKVAFRALDTDGHPLIRASVMAYMVDGGNLTGQMTRVTDRGGQTTLVGLAPGDYRVLITGWNASGNDLYLIERTVKVALGPTLDLGDVAPDAVSITLAARLEDGYGAARTAKGFFQNVALASDGVPAGVFEVDLPLDRQVRVWGLQPATYALTAMVTKPSSQVWDSAYEAFKGEYKLVQDSDIPVLFKKRANPREDLGSVELRVLAGPASTPPDETLRLYIFHEQALFQVYDGIPRTQDFQATIANMPKGRYLFAALGESSLGRADISMERGETKNVDLDMSERPVRLKAKTRWRETGEYFQPIAASVVYGPEWKEGVPPGRAVGQARISSDGALEVSLLPALPFVLYIRSSDGRAGVVRVQHDSAEGVVEEDLFVEPAP